MANALYDLGRQGFLEGSIDWDTDNIKAVLVDEAAYTPNLATDQFLSDIPAPARIATSANLTTKTVAAGVADADDVQFTTVSGPSIESIVIYKDTGTAGTSRLICRIDTAAGLPQTPSGGDIVIQWDSGANKIFRL